MKLCTHCQGPLSRHGIKFCSRSCAAKFNNTGRVRSEQSRLRTRKSIKKFHEINPQAANKFGTACLMAKEDKIIGLKSKWSLSRIKRRKCTECNIMFWATPTSFTQYGQPANFKSTCGDKCFIKTKESNCHGNKIIVNGVSFDSHWEVIFSRMLTEVNIVWERCFTSFPWVDDKGKTRKYFPDFYLPDIDVYCDTKNKFLQNRDKDKLDQASKQIALFVGTPEEIFEKVAGLAGIKPAVFPVETEDVLRYTTDP